MIAERNAPRINGFIGLLAAAILLYVGIRYEHSMPLLVAIILYVIVVLLLSGIVVIQPNQAKAVLFFGAYQGTINKSGIWLTIPLTTKRTVSLRVQNFNSERLTVNDKDGNPVEIAAVVVFKVIDTAAALFEVDDYRNFVQVQSEAGIRHVASQYPYDSYGNGGYSLREHANEIAEFLQKELQERLDVSGVQVTEARLTHLTYAPEIAGAMLQRQQAAAIVAARELIVEAAVGMVKMAIRKLEEDGVVELDEERKANMANNLMVSITSERPSQTVINTGSLY